MWKMKLKVKHNDCPVVNRCSKFGVDVLSYPSTWYRKGEEKRVNHICFLQGSAEQKTAFLKDFQSDPNLMHLEVEGNLFTYQYRLAHGGQHVQLYYNNQMVFVEPVFNSQEGFEYWHVASWDKEVLSKFYADLLKNMDFLKMLSFGESPLKNVYFPNVMPNLSPKQARAIELAFRLGYYHYPRKITLREMATRSGTSLSTFQENLRKAEIVLLPKIVEQFVESVPQREMVIKARLKKAARSA
ncbi:MAG TPA: helix-turn-helix domain-containing protein [Candidatus Norongarragalinales archaeon]|nr:helix-turn-helix domain-containing protein [Candidatus Norongarragalinales archaeon]